MMHFLSQVVLSVKRQPVLLTKQTHNFHQIILFKHFDPLNYLQNLYFNAD